MRPLLPAASKSFIFFSFSILSSLSLALPSPKTIQVDARANLPPLPILKVRENGSSGNGTETGKAASGGGLPASTIFVIVILVLLVLASIPLTIFLVIKRRAASLASAELDAAKTPVPGRTPKTPSKGLKPLITARNAKFFSPGRDRGGSRDEEKWEEVELGRYGVKVSVRKSVDERRSRDVSREGHSGSAIAGIGEQERGFFASVGRKSRDVSREKEKAENGGLKRGGVKWKDHEGGGSLGGLEEPDRVRVRWGGRWGPWG